MATPVIRCLLLFLVVSDCAANWLLAAVKPTPPAEMRGDDESFVLLAVRYRMEIQQQIDEPAEASAALPVVVPPLTEPDLPEEVQALVLPPQPSADPLYVFMSLQR